MAQTPLLLTPQDHDLFRSLIEWGEMSQFWTDEFYSDIGMDLIEMEFLVRFDPAISFKKSIREHHAYTKDVDKVRALLLSYQNNTLGQPPEAEKWLHLLNWPKL